MNGPTLPPSCTECGAIGSVGFFLTYAEEQPDSPADVIGELEDAGWRCSECGAMYMQQSDAGPHDAMLDLAALIMEEELDE